MKRICSLLLIASVVVFSACSGGGGKSKIDQIKERSKIEPADPYASWESNNGIGPIATLSLEEAIDQEMADMGLEVFEAKCTACHKAKKRFIGPSPKDILTRRTPEWVMNMILNPEEMVQKDPMAKQLLIDFNGSPMANQNLTEEEARAVLEYFRTL